MKTLAALTFCILAAALALEAPAANIGAAPGTLMTYRGTNVLPRVAMDKDYFGWDGTSMWVTSIGPLADDLNANCHDILSVHEQTDCNGCTTHYSDGAIGVPSGVIYYGCTSNTPAVGDMKCSNEVWTTEELIASESGGFFDSSGVTRRFMRYTCREWDGDSWEVVDNQDIDGTVNIHGNLLLMDGWGTNIISAGSTGNILAGTNNGTIYLGPKAMGNSIHVRVTSGPGSFLHIGTNTSYNLIQGVVDGVTIRIDNNVLYNRLSFLADGDPCLRVRDNVYNSDIHALSIDGGVGNGWDVGNITNCAIRGVKANPYAVYSASNLMGCTISTPTNVANLANAVVADSVYVSGASLHVGETHVTSSGSGTVDISAPSPRLVFAAEMDADITDVGVVASNVNWGVILTDIYNGWDSASESYHCNTNHNGRYMISFNAHPSSSSGGVTTRVIVNSESLASGSQNPVTEGGIFYQRSTLLTNGVSVGWGVEGGIPALSFPATGDDGSAGIFCEIWYMAAE